MPLRLEAPPADEATRGGALQDLLGAIQGLAGPFQPLHAELNEDFFGYRLRLPGEELSLAYRPRGDASLVAVHRSGAGVRRYCLPPGAWHELRRGLAILLTYLHGDEFEFDHTLAARRPLLRDGTVVFQDRWWDHWEDHPFGTRGLTLGHHYRDLVHPLVQQVVGRLLPLLPPRPRIVDLGGGQGRLLRLLGLGGHLVERNERQLEMARHGQPEGVELHAADIRSIPDYAALATGPVHIALAVGSLHVNGMVPEHAWKLVHGLLEDLAPGGFLLAAGHTPFLLNADDLELIGYEVLNTGVPSKGQAGGQLRQLYLARRPS